MTDPLPILSGHKAQRSFEIFEPVQGEFSLLCRVVIRERDVIIWDQEIHGEDRTNAIHCDIRVLDGFFDNLLLPPAQVQRPWTPGATLSYAPHT